MTRSTLAAAAALLLAACASGNAASGADAAAPRQESRLDRDLARVRAATSRFRSLDSAVVAGYPHEVARCLANDPHGAMGFHHANRALMDNRLEIERPEILLYSRHGGSYALNGVEYIVPFSAHPRDARPPRIMGQALKPSEALQLWYLHVWIWTENPSGMFADWNPAVRC